MGEIERLLPGTKVSDWASTAIFANRGKLPGNAAYFAGGGYAVHTSIDRFEFADDSRTTIAAGLSVARHTATGSANSGVAAYWGGGGN